MTATNSDKIRVGIAYGLVGGTLNSKKLRKLLKKAGYESTGDLDRADIIIAHSAGCWLIPKTATPKLVFYIGAPLNSAHSLRVSLRANLEITRHSGFSGNLRVRLLNVFYMLLQIRRNLSIILHPKVGHIIVFKCPAIFLANQYDPWPQGKELEKLITERQWSFVSLGGAHDDIWLNPDRYIEIINHYAGLLV